MASPAISPLVYNLHGAGAGAGLRSVISRTRARHTAQPRARNHGPETRYRHYHTPFPPHWDGEISWRLSIFLRLLMIPKPGHSFFILFLDSPVPTHILYFWQQYHGRVKMVAGWLLFKQPRARTNVRQSAGRVFIEIYWTLDFKYFCTIYHLSLGWYFYQRAAAWLRALFSSSGAQWIDIKIGSLVPGQSGARLVTAAWRGGGRSVNIKF